MRARVRLGQRNGDNGMLEHHPLLAEAAAIASRHVKRDARSMVADPLWEDVVSVAVLALVERIHDVDEAVVRFLKNERAWRFHAMPLLLE